MATAQAITWRERLGAYYYLCRFDNPIGTELVFWPTLWALWIAAQGMPRIEILIPMILGVIFMRAAGCAINDFADRKVDAHVERTKNRPLATGVISAKEAVAQSGWQLLRGQGLSQPPGVNDFEAGIRTGQQGAQETLGAYPALFALCGELG